MTGLYVASNVQSLGAQVQLQRNMGTLGEILTRLSTGLRINSGKDDPAGLIASELLKADITGTNMAIRNTQRANSIIAIADSALGQISNLLNDIKALVVEAANTGAMNAAQIAANQLQVDASIDSIDRISKMTNFQGMLLLDGSLDFEVRGVDRSAVQDLNIYQANFGTQSKIEITADIIRNATRGQLIYDKGGVSTRTTLEVTGNSGSSVFTFEAGTTVDQIAKAINLVSDSTGVRAVVGSDATFGQIMLTSAGLDNDINLTSLIAGAAGGNWTVKYSAGNSTETTYTITQPQNGQPGVIDFKLQMEPSTAPANAALDEAFNGIYTYNITNGIPAVAAGEELFIQSSNGDQITKVEFIFGGAGSGSDVAVNFDRSKGFLQIQYGDAATAADFENAINAIDGLEMVGFGANFVTNFVGNERAGWGAPMDVRANNALNITATVPGSKYENTDVVYVYDGGTPPQWTGPTTAAGVGLEYVDGPQSAAATITWLTDGITMRLVGKETGAALNDVKIVFEQDDAYDPGKVTAVYDEKNKILHVYGQVDNATPSLNASYGALKAAIEEASPFRVDITDDSASSAELTLAGATFKFTAEPAGDFNDVEIVFAATGTSGWSGNTLTIVDTDLTFTNAGTVQTSLQILIDGLGGAPAGLTGITVDWDGTAFGGTPSSLVGYDVALSGGGSTPLALGTQISSGLTTIKDGIADAGGTNSITTGQVYGDIGTDHQAIFVIVQADTVTANDVIAAFKDPANAKIAANFTVTNAIDSTGTGLIFDSLFDPLNDGTDPLPFARVFISALTGGNDGSNTVVTAKELVEFINNDSVLSQLFEAALGYGQYGNGLLTLFDEAAYYGSTWDETGLQFLGPKDSPDIMFVADGPSSPLYITYIDPETGACVSDTRPIAYLAALDANAAFSVQAYQSGVEYENMAIRLIRLDDNHLTDETSYVQYVSGPSTAMAYCSINNDPLTTGTVDEIGKFIVYAVQGGDQYNDVSVIAKFDEDQTSPAIAYYDEEKKQLVVTVNDLTTVTLEDAMEAIKATGIFTADFDFSNNRSGPGLDTTFGEILSVTNKQAVIGNTGSTGGYNGVLEVYVGGNATANNIITAINSDPVASKLFNATAVGSGSSAGTGTIDFRGDNVKTVTDSTGKTKTVPGLVTSIAGTEGTEKGYMVIHLATDEFGNSITTARDLVNFFDKLTVEQTRGISVSLVRPPGVDNLNRLWEVDNCGNVTVTQLCDDSYGKGILKPTIEFDDCDNAIIYPIQFWSFGQDIKPGYASGRTAAVNGVDASLEIIAKISGPEYNGVTLQYVSLMNPLDEMYTEYDPSKKLITVYIQGDPTAAAIKNLIESSEATKDLFRAELLGTGSGKVSSTDKFVPTSGGVYEAGYRGGAHMLGAADADPHRLTLETVDEGSSQRIMVRALEGDFSVKNASGVTSEIEYGTDTVAMLNGTAMTSDGRKISIDSAMLKLDMTLAEKIVSGDRIQFSITGGGATFQIGPEVTSNQQIRIGIQSVNSARLGGASGRLYMLRSGGMADLRTDTKLADRIVQDAITAIAQTRGRLGALQRSTLEPAIITLQDTVEQLSAAEAQISNADFAEESSRLTRAQILVQAGTRTLAIANQFPQYAASLLG